MIASSGHGHRRRHRFIVRFVLRCCGFFLLRCRVDSFHSAAQCRPCCFPLLWILSTSEPCGFFPLGGAVLSALFSDVVDSFHFRAVWILSARRLSGVRFVSRCCGFFGFDVIIVVVVVIVVMNITVSRSPPPVQLEGMHRRPRTALTMIVITIVVIVVVVADVVIVVALVVSFEVPSSSSAESNHAS